MGIILTFLHVLVCVILMVVILLQSSKGGGLAGTFGGSGGGGAIFGGRGAATFLSKVTSILAVIFFLSCIGHTILSRQGVRPQSVIQQAVQEGTLTPSPASMLPGVGGGAEGTGAQPADAQGGAAGAKSEGTTQSNK